MFSIGGVHNYGSLIPGLWTWLYSDTENINFVKIRNLDTIVNELHVVALVDQSTIVLSFIFNWTYLHARRLLRLRIYVTFHQNIDSFRVRRM